MTRLMKALASLGSVKLGTLAPAGHARLVLRVSLPAAGDELQGRSATAGFELSATAV